MQSILLSAETRYHAKSCESSRSPGRQTNAVESLLNRRFLHEGEIAASYARGKIERGADGVAKDRKERRKKQQQNQLVIVGKKETKEEQRDIYIYM